MHVLQETQETGVRSPRKGNGNPLQYSLLKNPMDRGAWRATVRRIAELDTTKQPSPKRSNMSSVSLVRDRTRFQT